MRGKEGGGQVMVEAVYEMERRGRGGREMRRAVQTRI